MPSSSSGWKFSIVMPRREIRAARVIHRVVARLRGALRIEPQAAALPCRAGKAAVGLPLRERVEHNVVGVLQNLAELALRVGGRVDMGLAAEFLMTEPCLVQTGGGRARRDTRAAAGTRKTWRTPSAPAGSSRRCVRATSRRTARFCTRRFSSMQVAGRRKLSKSHISPPAPACR